MKTAFISLLFVCLGMSSYSQFSNHKPLSHSTSSARAVSIADIDGDGDLDVVSASTWDDKIACYENDGSGVFGHQKILSSTVDGAWDVMAADLDGDGDVDVLAAAAAGDEVVWFENLGTGNFGPVQVVGNQDYPTSIYAIDLDGDADLDVICNSTVDDKISWYENLGGGSFGGQQTISTQTNNPRGVYAADLDGDGDADVLSASASDNKIAWYENLGGSFGPQQIITTQTDYPISVHSQDLDGDGDQDVLSASQDDDVIAWYENLGGGTFGPQQVLNTQAEWAKSVNTADIDGDGDQDVVFASMQDDVVGWHENLGGGVFGAEQVITGVANGAWDVQCADLDGNGSVDVLAASSYDHHVAWYSNAGGGSFGTIQLVSMTANYPNDVFARDLDGDGDQDVVASARDDNAVVWYENLGTNGFAVGQYISLDVFNVKAMYPEDLDGDGDIDILSGSSAGTIAWHENLGSGLFAPQQVISNQSLFPAGVYAADLDGDGDPEVLTASANDSTISWFENLGGGLFGSEQFISTVLSGAVFVRTADINGDGFVDVLAAAGTSNKVVWYENFGNGTFGTEQIINGSSYSPSHIVTHDVDADGDPDILVCSYQSDKIVWHENLGGGSIGPEQLISNFVDGPRGLNIGDLDNDGDGDLLSATLSGDKVAWYENMGGGVFGSQQLIDQNVEGATWVTSGDLDGDGDNDVMCAASFANSVVWYENYVIDETQIRGRAFIDINQNNMLDSVDIGVNQIGIFSTPQSHFSYTYSSGNYFMNFSDTLGSYLIAPENLPYWNIVTDSLSYSIQVDSNFVEVDSLDFGFYPDTIVDQVSPELTGAFPRCSTTINYWLDVHNTGTTMPSGVIELVLDDQIIYSGANPAPDSILGQNIYWSYDSLMYFDHALIHVYVDLPGFASIGDTLESQLQATVVDSFGNTVFTWVDTLDQILVCAYDPNDKIVNPAGIDSMGYIDPSTSLLEYTIRFQNTGNDTAINVVVTDQLDANLDWITLTPLSSSDDMQISVDQYGEVTFSFLNIMLPDSNVNELASHGFVKYCISINSNVPVGTSIYNTGHIFFDTNPAVVTNTTISTLYLCNTSIDYTLMTTVCEGDTLVGNATDSVSTANFSWDLAGVAVQSTQAFSWIADTVGVFNMTLTAANQFCTLDTIIEVTVTPQPLIEFSSGAIDTLCLEDGTIPLPAVTPVGGAYTGPGVVGVDFDPVVAGAGVHFVSYSFADNNGCTATDSIQIVVEICSGISTLDASSVTIHPNPFHEFTTLSFGQALGGDYTLKIYDVLGKEVFSSKELTSTDYRLDQSALGRGVFLLTLIHNSSGAVVYTAKLIAE